MRVLRYFCTKLMLGVAIQRSALWMTELGRLHDLCGHIVLILLSILFVNFIWVSHYAWAEVSESLAQVCLRTNIFSTLLFNEFLMLLLINLFLLIDGLVSSTSSHFLSLVSISFIVISLGCWHWASTSRPPSVFFLVRRFYFHLRVQVNLVVSDESWLQVCELSWLLLLISSRSPWKTIILFLRLLLLSRRLSCLIIRWGIFLLNMTMIVCMSVQLRRIIFYLNSIAHVRIRYELDCILVRWIWLRNWWTCVYLTLRSTWDSLWHIGISYHLYATVFAWALWIDGCDWLVHQLSESSCAYLLVWVLHTISVWLLIFFLSSAFASSVFRCLWFGPLSCLLFTTCLGWKVNFVSDITFLIAIGQ